MTSRKVGDKWFVVKKDGSLGKRGYTTQSNALAAQKRGKSFTKGSPTKGGARKAAHVGSTHAQKKMTVGKALDLYSIGGPALNYGLKAYYEGGAAKDNALAWAASVYSGYDYNTGTFEAKKLVAGYGGAINRAIEKKGFKMLRIRGPRSTIKTPGDILDYMTYFGATAMEVYQNKDNPVIANQKAFEIQNGIDLSSTSPYNPTRMLSDKIVPYVAQKYIRKVLRRANINFGGMLG